MCLLKMFWVCELFVELISSRLVIDLVCYQGRFDIAGVSYNDDKTEAQPTEEHMYTNNLVNWLGFRHEPEFSPERTSMTQLMGGFALHQTHPNGQTDVGTDVSLIISLTSRTSFLFE